MSHSEFCSFFEGAFIFAGLTVLNADKTKILLDKLRLLNVSDSTPQATFCYWLCGFIEGGDLDKGLNEAQIKLICAKYGTFEKIESPVENPVAPVVPPVSSSWAWPGSSELVKC